MRLSKPVVRHAVASIRTPSREPRERLSVPSASESSAFCSLETLSETPDRLRDLRHPASRAAKTARAMCGLRPWFSLRVRIYKSEESAVPVRPWCLCQRARSAILRRTSPKLIRVPSPKPCPRVASILRVPNSAQFILLTQRALCYRSVIILRFVLIPDR
jgi:hypothetical protein